MDAGGADDHRDGLPGESVHDRDDRGNRGDGRPTSKVVYVSAGFNCARCQLPVRLRRVPRVQGHAVQRRVHRRARHVYVADPRLGDHRGEQLRSSTPRTIRSRSSGRYHGMTAAALTRPGTTYDRATPLLQRIAIHHPGVHSLYFSIFDHGRRDLRLRGAARPPPPELGRAGCLYPARHHPSATKTADAPSAGPGTANGYTISIANPHTGRSRSPRSPTTCRPGSPTRPAPRPERRLPTRRSSPAGSPGLARSPFRPARRCRCTSATTVATHPATTSTRHPR